MKASKRFIGALSASPMGLTRRFLAQIAAALLLLSMLLTAGLPHAEQRHGGDAAQLICSAQVDSPEARAALAELSEAVGFGGAHEPHGPTPHDHDDHCPACALAKAIALPEHAALPAFAALNFAPAAPRADRASPRQTAGPPVGLRAPPLTV